jgi:hypothetical protein
LICEGSFKEKMVLQIFPSLLHLTEGGDRCDIAAKRHRAISRKCQVADTNNCDRLELELIELERDKHDPARAKERRASELGFLNR